MVGKFLTYLMLAVGGVLCLCFPVGMVLWVFYPWGWKVAIIGIGSVSIGLYVTK